MTVDLDEHLDRAFLLRQEPYHLLVAHVDPVGNRECPVSGFLTSGFDRSFAGVNAGL